MNDWLQTISLGAPPDRALAVARAVIVLALALGVGRLASGAIRRMSDGRLSPQHKMLARRVVFYTFAALGVVSGMRELGFGLHVFVGAAGVLTVALGFASQTSASNLISGLFLIVEAPFVIGETIRVGDTTGEVVAIDLLSVKLRTFDNLFVRIPNETLVKSQITNLSRFPIRRLDMTIGVAYREDIRRVRETLEDVARDNPLCLEDPPPVFIFLGYGDSALNLQFSVWAARDNFLPLRNSMHLEIKEAFDARGIEIPFPHRTLYAGSDSAPLPVRVLGDAPRTGTRG